MKKNKIFVACDSTNILRIKKIIKETKNTKLNIGYKFGLEFLNSKYGRKFLSKLKNKVTFADLKIFDIPNTCVSAIRAIKDLKVNYLNKWSGFWKKKNIDECVYLNLQYKLHPFQPILPLSLKSFY